MIKKTGLIIGLCLLSGFVFSQRIMHGAGTGVFINFGPQIRPAIPTILTYSPRINFVENEKLSVSAGIPLSIGFGSSYNSVSSSDGLEVSSQSTWVAHIPAMINLNLGAGSSKQTDKRFGFFIGAGFAYQFGGYLSEEYNWGTNEYQKKDAASFGPAANTGVRFAVGKRQKNIEVRVSYMGAISSEKISSVGIGALFNF